MKKKKNEEKTSWLKRDIHDQLWHQKYQVG